MKVSLLTPSRERPELLKRSIESLGKGDYEVIVVVDTDDPKLEEYKKMKINLLVEPNPYGYSQLHKYYNWAAEKSKGDWLMIWNDDAVMETPGWVDKISEFDHTKPVVLSLFHEVNNLFPVISRKFYETIGHYGQNTHADSWVQQIGERTGTQVYVPGIKIVHVKPMDNTGQASTFTAVNDTGPKFSSPDTQELINEDVIKIKEVL